MIWDDLVDKKKWIRAVSDSILALGMIVSAILITAYGIKVIFSL